jgi:hypothetical protein
MAAFCLICTGVAYHTAVSIGGGAIIAAYAAVVPLRLLNQIAALPLRRLALQLVTRATLIVGVVYLATLTVNSGLPVIDTVGSLLFIGLLVLLAAMVFRVGTRGTVKSFRLVAANSPGAVALARAQVDLVLNTLPLRRSS